MCKCVGMFASNPYVEEDGVMLSDCDGVCSVVLSGSFVLLMWSVFLLCVVRGGVL